MDKRKGLKKAVRKQIPETDPAEEFNLKILIVEIENKARDFLNSPIAQRPEYRSVLIDLQAIRYQAFQALESIRHL